MTALIRHTTIGWPHRGWTHPNANVNGPGASGEDFQRIQFEFLNLRAQIEQRRDAEKRIDRRRFVAGRLTPIPAQQREALERTDHLDRLYIGERVDAEGGIC